MNGLFTWQEPFRPYFGKEVEVVIFWGKRELKIRGKLAVPTKSYCPPKLGRMKILKENGKEMLLRADKIKQIQEVNQ